MAKRRRYGDAWKDVQIDAEQNDAVFDRFFKRTQHDPDPTVAGEEPPSSPAAGKGSELPAPTRTKSSAAPAARRPEKRPQPRASVSRITHTLPNLSSETDTLARVGELRRQFRLSKGEAAVLRCLLDKANENGGTECYTKIPQLADLCELTHRGCQFALRNLESRGFIVRLKDYDPADRLGIKFRLSLPTA